jgi:hypothetical protein
VCFHGVGGLAVWPLGEKLAAFMRAEQTGCISVASGIQPMNRYMEVVEKMVARG